MNGNADMAVRQLVGEMNELKIKQGQLKKSYEEKRRAIEDIINPEDMLRRAGKLEDGGSKTETMYGCSLNVKAEKKVKWDSEQLQRVAETLEWKDVVLWFKIEFSITEKLFKELEKHAAFGNFDQGAFNKIKEARTVKIEQPKLVAASFE